MARIPPELLKRLTATLRLSQGRTYARIAAKANDMVVDPAVAALAIAREHSIPINRYATPEQMEQLRRMRGGGHTVPPPAPGAPGAPPATAEKVGGWRRAGRGAANRQDRKTIWVVHGRNLRARDELVTFLRAIGLEPIGFGQAARRTRRGAPYTGQVLDRGIGAASAIVVLLTPDDEGRLRAQYRKANDLAYEREYTGQARQNVLFEAGMALGRNERATILVQIGDLRPFSNVAGRQVVHLSNDPASRRELVRRLGAAGCAVDDADDDWLRLGNFEGLVPESRRRKRRPTRRGS